MKKTLIEPGYGEGQAAARSAASATADARGQVNAGMSRDLREAVQASQVEHKVWTTICNASAWAAIDRLAGGSDLTSR